MWLNIAVGQLRHYTNSLLFVNVGDKLFMQALVHWVCWKTTSESFVLRCRLWRKTEGLRSSSEAVYPVVSVRQLQDQDQDQDSLLMKRRNDNHSPGPVIRELVPSTHQRSELSNTILCIFSGWDQTIGEGIPIPDSLGAEATFINICIGNGSLKCHRVLISITPSFGDKVICWYTGFTFKTFI